MQKALAYIKNQHRWSLLSIFDQIWNLSISAEQKLDKPTETRCCQHFFLWTENGHFSIITSKIHNIVRGTTFLRSFDFFVVVDMKVSNCKWSPSAITPVPWTGVSSVVGQLSTSLVLSTYKVREVDMCSVSSAVWPDGANPGEITADDLLLSWSLVLITVTWRWFHQGNIPS